MSPKKQKPPKHAAISSLFMPPASKAEKAALQTKQQAEDDWNRKEVARHREKWQREAEKAASRSGPLAAPQAIRATCEAATPAVMMAEGE